MYDFDTWKTVAPPLGTVYNYPPRGDEQTSIAGARRARKLAHKSTTRRSIR
jgi:hypothetical protein